MRSLRHLAGSTLGFLRGSRVQRRATVETLLLDRVVRRPIVYTDDLGLRYVLYPGENAGVYITSGGNYEASEVAFCRSLLRPGQTVLDVGGNIGLYALLAAQSVGPAGRVHSFEPEPRNAERLRANVALNGFRNIDVFEAAVYSSRGTVVLNVFDARFNAWHSLGRPELPDPDDPSRSVAPAGRREVTAVTLDEHCAEHGISSVALLKIDVEGAEVDALQGARTLLERRAVGALLFEVSLPQIEALGHDAAAPFAILDDAGYDCFTLTTEGTTGERIRAATDRYANYVALPRDA